MDGKTETEKQRIRRRKREGWSAEEAEKTPPLSKAEAGRSNRGKTPWRGGLNLGGGENDGYQNKYCHASFSIILIRMHGKRFFHAN